MVITYMAALATRTPLNSSIYDAVGAVATPVDPYPDHKFWTIEQGQDHVHMAGHACH